MLFLLKRLHQLLLLPSRLVFCFSCNEAHALTRTLISSINEIVPSPTKIQCLTSCLNRIRMEHIESCKTLWVSTPNPHISLRGRGGNSKVILVFSLPLSSGSQLVPWEVPFQKRLFFFCGFFSVYSIFKRISSNTLPSQTIATSLEA